jgi:REP element-mobilizing transposase RayT
MIAINNMPDHIHILIGLNPAQSISNIMQMVKGDSSEWINKEKLTEQKFCWQNGYGAFSYSRSQIDRVAKYIAHQQEHHRKQEFLEEYRQMLNKFAIDYDDRYIFQQIEG